MGPSVPREGNWRTDKRLAARAISRGDLNGAYGHAARGWKKIGPWGQKVVGLAEDLVAWQVDELKDEVKRCLVEALIYTSLRNNREPESCLSVQARFDTFFATIRAASNELRKRLA